MRWSRRPSLLSDNRHSQPPLISRHAQPTPLKGLADIQEILRSTCREPELPRYLGSGCYVSLNVVGYLPTAVRVDPSEQSSFTGQFILCQMVFPSSQEGSPRAQARLRAQARSKLAGCTDTGSPSQDRPSPAALLVRPGLASQFNQARVAHMADASQPGRARYSLNHCMYLLPTLP